MIRSHRPPDVELRVRLRDLTNQRRRFGYRWLFILLRDQREPSGISALSGGRPDGGQTLRAAMGCGRTDPGPGMT
jgi:hypothetical protein